MAGLYRRGRTVAPCAVTHISVALRKYLVLESCAYIADQSATLQSLPGASILGSWEDQRFHFLLLSAPNALGKLSDLEAATGQIGPKYSDLLGGSDAEAVDRYCDG